MDVNKRIKLSLYNALMIVLIFMTGSVLLLLNASRWLSRRWGMLNLEQLIFHMRAPSVGTSPDVIWDFVRENVPSVTLVIFFTVLVFTRSLKWSQKSQRTALGVSVIGFLVFSIVTWNYLWVVLNVQAFVENQQKISNFITENYVDPRDVDLVFPEEKRNLIHIYLESVETTFMATADGGAFDANLIPELTKLAREYVNFSPTNQLGGAQVTTGATWTSSGMFAQTAGLPLDVPINGDSILADSLLLTYQEVALFPSKVVTLGEILETQGYRQVLMMGSDATFGGRRYYFTQNGNYEIWDYNTAIEQGLIPKDYHVWWGFEDEKLFSFAQDKLLELGKSDQPFNFTMLTADTHFEDGFLNESCEEPFNEQYANVLACSSRKVYEFVRWIQKQPFYENTTIVITGDHLTMQSLASTFWEAFPVPKGYVRTVYNVFINAAIEPEITNGRTFTTMDIFPTTLASLGVQIEGDRLGLGTNLFSNQSTLVEQTGIELLNQELQRKSTFFENLIKHEH